MLRVSGSMEAIRFRVITEADFNEMLSAIAPERTWDDFTRTGDVDFSHDLPGVARYRVNLFRQQRGAGAVFRIIPSKIMSVSQLGLPDAVRRVAQLKSGLVLVTGPTGSGKSTTLAAIIDLINEKHSYHIITIEDPIEFVHPNKKCLVHHPERDSHRGAATAVISLGNVWDWAQERSARIVQVPYLSVKDITGGLPRVVELFEARHPREKAVITEVDGTVHHGPVVKGMRRVIVETEEGTRHEYLVPRSVHVNVQEGERIKAGDPLIDGPIDPHDVLSVLGIKELQKYLVDKIQEVYRSQ